MSCLSSVLVEVHYLNTDRYNIKKTPDCQIKIPIGIKLSPILLEMNKVPRGRPKKLLREQAIALAVQAYWQDSTDTVSLNEFCRRATLSKPSVYREFGNEDGLMKAALLSYQATVLAPVYQMIRDDRPFPETLDALVSLVTRNDATSSQVDDQSMPAGCLLVKMRESYNRLGEQVQQAIDDARQEALTVYENWVADATAKGEFTADLTPQLAAIYIDAQLNNALSLLARGEPRDEVSNILNVAFSVLK